MPPLFILCVAWLAGLALARLPEPRLAALWLSGLVTLLLLHRPRRPLAWPLLAAAVALMLLGLWYGQPSQPAVAPGRLPAESRVVRGRVTSWPRLSETGRQVRLRIESVAAEAKATERVWHTLAAPVEIEAWLPLYPVTEYGDEIEANGRLRRLEDLTDRRLVERLNQAGLAGQLRASLVRSAADGADGSGEAWAKAWHASDTWTLLQRGPVAWRGLARRAVTTSLDRHLPTPVAALAAGMLIGERSALPHELRTAFATTGTAHLLVVSGWNMTIVAGVVIWAGARLSLGRRPLWLIVTLTILAAYTLLVGTEPAVVRAALMGGLTALALALGRPADPLIGLATATTAMTIVQPVLIVDLGFQLSALATLGLIVALPPLTPWLARLPLLPRLIIEPLAASTAAGLAVEPLLAYHFGRISPIGPIINALVEPWVPLIMAGAIAVTLLGWLPVPLLADLAAGLTTLAAWPLLTVIERGAAMPYASLQLPAPSLFVVFGLYGLLGLAAISLLRPEPIRFWSSGLIAVGVQSCWYMFWRWGRSLKPPNNKKGNHQPDRNGKEDPGAITGVVRQLRHNDDRRRRLRPKGITGDQDQHHDNEQHGEDGHLH